MRARSRNVVLRPWLHTPSRKAFPRKTTISRNQLYRALQQCSCYSAWQTKDYANAQKYLKLSVAGNPTEPGGRLRSSRFDFAAATPEDMPNGLFWIARAADLSTDPKGKEQITKFGHSKYVKYHGSDEGWAQLLETAKTATAPPPDLATTITKYTPPTPEQQAAISCRRSSLRKWTLPNGNSSSPKVSRKIRQGLERH